VGSGGHIGLAGPPGMDPERAEQQRRLLEELKSAQSILMRRRAETVPEADDEQRQQTTPNGIHVDKPQVHTADAVWSKKPRSQLPAAADSAKVYFIVMMVALLTNWKLATKLFVSHSYEEQLQQIHCEKKLSN